MRVPAGKAVIGALLRPRLFVAVAALALAGAWVPAHASTSTPSRAGATAGSGAPSSADATHWAIHGYVTDPTGAAIQGVTVSDGNRATWTDAAGAYELDESVGVVSIRLSASKIGYTEQHRGVTIVDAFLGPQDFVLTPTG